MFYICSGTKVDLAGVHVLDGVHFATMSEYNYESYLADRHRFFQYYKRSLYALFYTRVHPNLAFPPMLDDRDRPSVFRWRATDRFYWRPDHNDVIIVRRKGGITEEIGIHPDTKEEVRRQFLWDVIYPKDIIFNVGRAVNTRTFQQMIAAHAPVNKRVLLLDTEIKLI